MNYYNSENWYFDFSDKDATKAAWKMGNYLPVLDFVTGGGSGCVDQDNYLYHFGGKRVDTLVNSNTLFAFRILLQKNTAGTGVAGTWETLLKSVPTTVINPSVVVNPTYPNQIFVIPDHGQGQGAAYTYDIYANTLTPTTMAGNVIFEGTDWGRVCADNKIYCVGGAGTYIYTPPTAVSNTNPILLGSGSLTTIPGVLSPTRSYSTYTLVPAKDLSEAKFIPSTCTG